MYERVGKPIVARSVEIVDQNLRLDRLFHGDEHRLLIGIDQALENLTSIIEETGAKVEVGPLPIIRGNAGLLLRLFQNLIGNALKYRSEAVPRIRVSANEQQESCKFTVQDNGVGFNPDIPATRGQN